MGNRILKETICTSDTIDVLSPEEERLFYRLIVRADDYGRLDGRLPIIRSGCFPLKTETIELDALAAWLQTLEGVGLIRQYIVADKPYYQISSWDQHQQVRNKRSRFPDPLDQEPSSDSVGDHPISLDINCASESNPIQSKENPTRASVMDDEEEPKWNAILPNVLREPLKKLAHNERAAHPDKSVPFKLGETQQLRLAEFTKKRMTWDAIAFVAAECADQERTWSYFLGTLTGMYNEGKRTKDDVMGFRKTTGASRAAPQLKSYAEAMQT